MERDRERQGQIHRNTDTQTNTDLTDTDKQTDKPTSLTDEPGDLPEDGQSFVCRCGVWGHVAFEFHSVSKAPTRRQDGGQN